MSRGPALVFPVLLAALLACSGPAETGGERAVVRVDTGDPMMRGPIHVFADGRVVTAAVEDRSRPGVMRGFVVRRLTGEALRTVLEAAAGAGLDRSARYPGPPAAFGELVAGPAVTTFTFDDGELHRSEVEDLGRYFFGRQVPWRVRDGRLRILEFHQRLRHLEQWLPEGSLGPEEEFAFDRVMVVVAETPARTGFPETPQTDWPLGSLDGFGKPLAAPVMIDGPSMHPARCAVVEGEEVDRLREAADSAPAGTAWVSEGRRHSVRFTPLLPDEPDCPGEGSP